MAHRKLTDHEKDMARDAARIKAETENPGATIRVSVRDEADTNGDPIVDVTIIKRSFIQPPGRPK